ncbi:MAG: hypothetical protein ABW321_21520 [Polyangiales bacterium]
MRRWLLAAAIAASALVNVQPCSADDDAPSIVGYGFEALGTGAASGLAIGFLSTGDEFRSNEWRKLGWGTAIGALTGLGVGVLLGTVDAATGQHRGVGFYMVRDSSYGWTVGAVAGGIIGAIIWLGDGNGKDLLRGLAYGTVIGAGTGLLLGILEGVLRRNSGSSSSTQAARLRFSVGFSEPGSSGVPVPHPALSGRF